MQDTEAEASLIPRGPDPYAPYWTPGLKAEPGSVGPYQQEFYESTQQLPLVANVAPFHGDYEDYNTRKSFRDDNYNTHSALTSNCDDSLSHLGSKSYAPSRNMFHNTDNKVLMEKDALLGEIQVVWMDKPNGRLAGMEGEAGAERRHLVCLRLRSLHHHRAR
jgi:chitin synthase